MANVAIGFGLALVVLGLAGYVGTGMESPTALIPAVFGIVLVLLGFLARNPARRKMAMHIAVIVGILGFFGSVRGLGATVLMLAGQPAARPVAAVSQAFMALLTLGFTVMCIRSFINARRAGTMEDVR